MVTTLAGRVREDAIETVARARPGTALSRYDPEIVAAREVFRAVHGRSTDPGDLIEAERTYLASLERRMQRSDTDTVHPDARYRSLEVPDRSRLSMALATATSLQHEIDRDRSL